MPQWKGKTEGGEANQSRLIGILKRVDIRVIYCFLPFAVFYYLIAARKRAGAIYRYLRHRQGFSFFKACIGTYRNHLLFAKFLMDRFYVYAGHKERFTVDSFERDVVVKYFSTDKPLVMVGAHVGNFEISSYFCGRLPKKLNVLAFAGETQQMQKVRSSAMEENNIEMISVSEDMDHIFRLSDAIRNGEAITLAGDRFLTGRRNQKFMFLGKEAVFPTGIYSIADKYDADVIALFVLGAGKNFYYKIHVEQITIDSDIKGREERARAYGQKYVSILEKVVREHPLQWFNFYDFWNTENEND